MSGVAMYSSIKLLKITKHCGGNFSYKFMLIGRRKTERMFLKMLTVVSFVGLQGILIFLFVLF